MVFHRLAGVAMGQGHPRALHIRASQEVWLVVELTDQGYPDTHNAGVVLAKQLVQHRLVGAWSCARLPW